MHWSSPGTGDRGLQRSPSAIPGRSLRARGPPCSAADGFHLWSQTYDHSVGDAFAVQTRIAESVAGALGVLLDERKRATMDAIGVHDVEAF
ncbi:MAG: hypothetical protein IPF84_08070 [Proteobacteria bacterium]|nr:hypothetical protein [Pseudomonadota bacterium]